MKLAVVRREAGRKRMFCGAGLGWRRLCYLTSIAIAATLTSAPAMRLIAVLLLAALTVGIEDV
jgi:hypothetical protein